MDQVCETSVDLVRLQSVALLNQSLVAAMTLRDIAHRSSRKIHGSDCVMSDDPSAKIAHLMQAFVVVMFERLVDLGEGVRLSQLQKCHCLPVEVFDVTDPDLTDSPHLGGLSPLDVFARSIMNASAMTEAFGDSTTANLLARVWWEVDQYRWSTLLRTVVEQCRMSAGAQFPVVSPFSEPIAT